MNAGTFINLNDDSLNDLSPTSRQSDSCMGDEGGKGFGEPDCFKDFPKGFACDVNEDAYDNFGDSITAGQCDVCSEFQKPMIYGIVDKAVAKKRNILELELFTPFDDQQENSDFYMDDDIGETWGRPYSTESINAFGDYQKGFIVNEEEETEVVWGIPVAEEYLQRELSTARNCLSVSPQTTRYFERARKTAG